METTDSKLRHDTGHPASFGRYDYLAVNDTDYVKLTRGPILSSDHPLVLAVQSIVDGFDHVIRERYPDQMRGIPLPVIAVRKTTEVGAFTMDRQRVCYELPIQISSGVPVAANTTLTAIEARSGRLSPTQFFSCARVKVQPEERAEFALWFSRRFAPCRMEMRSGNDVDSPITSPINTLTGPCREQDFFPRKSVAGGLVAEVAPNRLLLFSGIFAILKSVDQLNSVIAHELAHYYRAHVANVRPYDFCYRISKESHGHSPSPDPGLDDLCSRLRPRIGFSVSEATERRMGYYTVEQEADELALEYLALVGVSPDSAVEAWFKLAEHSTGDLRSTDAKYDIPLESCLKFRANGWRDERGQEVFIPVGDYRGTHHSWCHRIFNIDQEILAHNYVLGRRLLPDLDWTVLQKLALE